MKGENKSFIFKLDEQNDLIKLQHSKDETFYYIENTSLLWK
jgi:hypothetical protein